MRITVFGTGYVGLVTALGFAELGHTVQCFDLDPKKCDQLNRGVVPFYEAGARERLHKFLNKRITFYSDFAKLKQKSDLFIVAIGLAGKQNGTVDAKPLFDLIFKIQKQVKNKPVILKTTSPIGTHVKLQSKFPNMHFITSPEFLSEGSAFEDFFEPSRIIIAGTSRSAIDRVKLLYKPLVKRKFQLLEIDPTSAEIAKHAANAMLATKISFINEIAKVCEREHASVRSVKAVLEQDPRIGPHFINAGIGYGGSCLPKDVMALVDYGKSHKLSLPLIQGTQSSNELHSKNCLLRLKKIIQKNKIKTISVLGLSFKPETDDVRESPALKIVKGLLNFGLSVQAYDPEASKNAEHNLKHKQIRFCKNRKDCFNNSEMLVVLTDWSEFKKISPREIKRELKKPIVFDGRNIFDSRAMIESGIQYHSIGESYYKVRSVGEA